MKNVTEKMSKETDGATDGATDRPNKINKSSTK